MPIPPFTIDGLLPPFTGVSAADRAGMSPYLVTMEEVVHRFATSPERRAILLGLLEFRKRIHLAGVVEGFQWLDGSFVEDIDPVRAPQDIDVVTFFRRPAPASDDAAIRQFMRDHQEIFGHRQVKRELHCDSYWVDLTVPDPVALVGQTRYWFGLFSHQRVGGQWKGMLQVAVGTLREDDLSVKMLNSMAI